MSSAAFDSIALKWGEKLAIKLYRHLQAQADGVPLRARHVSDFIGATEDQTAAMLDQLVASAVVIERLLPVCPTCDAPVEDDDECDLCQADATDFPTARHYFVSGSIAWWAPRTPVVAVAETVERSWNMGIKASETALKYGKIEPWTDIKRADYEKVVTTMSGVEQDEVLHRLERWGFCLLRHQGLSPTHEKLLSLEQWLGPAREKQNFWSGKIKGIEPKEGVEANTGDSAKELLPHVDGTQDTPLPPAILVFQYDTSPTFGGTSTFVDMAHVLLSLSDDERDDIVVALSQPDAATCTKKKKVKKPDGTEEELSLTYSGALIKTVCAGHSLSCRLRFDNVLKVKPEYEKQFNRLKELVLAQPQLTYTPQEGDIAIFDNWRVLHGRKPVGGRHIRLHDRMWIDGVHPRSEGRYLLGVRGLPVTTLATIASRTA